MALEIAKHGRKGTRLLADSILAGLNPEQRRAVEKTEGPVLVVAGAGSGKTRVLTSRIAYLIGVCGIPSESILAVTFTNKAAGEMRTRVEKTLGRKSKTLWLGTFHSVCVRLLRREIAHLGMSRGFVIYDDADSLSVVKEALRRHSLDPKVVDPRRTRWRIDQWKNAGKLPARVAEGLSDIDDEQTSEIYATYQRILADANALDFGDLLLLTVELFRRFPEVLAHYQRRWQYVLVDEYQDTNRVQYELVNLLAKRHRNICVVGDPDQSIYGWRGADIRNIMDFEKDYSDASVIKLERNYRSTQAILSGAAAVVKNNHDRLDKTMFTEREGGDKIRFFAAHDERDEAQWVVRQILASNHRDHNPYGDHAILYRTNAQSRNFEEELLKYNIPYVVVGGVRFYDRAEVKDALSYLRLVVNPKDDQALRRIINRPTRGIGKTTVDRAAELASREGTSLLEAFGSMLEGGAAGRTAKSVKIFLSMMTALREEVAGQSIDHALACVLERSGYLSALAADGTPEAETRVDNLKELVTSAEDFHADNLSLPELVEGELERSEFELYLDQIALISDLDDYDVQRDHVSLMTAHSAKGLEFPRVFMVGMEEGVFPHASASRDDDGLEEERRLCYVGMTRAMEHLTLSAAHERRRWGESSYQMPSRFLQEIPREIVEMEGEFGEPPRLRAVPSTSRSRNRGGNLDHSYSQEPAGDDLDPQIRKGMRVRHAVFGVGTILNSRGQGLNTKIDIRFDKAGMKTVMVKYANLEPA